MNLPIVNLYNLGRSAYSQTLNIQQVLFNRLKGQVPLTASNHHGQHMAGRGLGEPHVGQPGFIGNSLILVEHEPVYTIGIRSKQYDENYATRLRSILAEKKISADFVHTNRGGLITFHGPGQLVAYPIIQLTDFRHTIPNKSVRNYVHLLEVTIIDTLARVGLPGAHTVPEYPGVWVDNGERKIAFVGISCKRFVTMHGISINCDCDLAWFEHIVSCGIEDKKITSVRKEMLALGQVGAGEIEHVKGRGEKFSVDHISRAFCSAFSKQFNCELREELRTSIAERMPK